VSSYLLFVVIGIFLGWYCGRWWAEKQRAHFDRARTWDQRRNYRNKDNWPDRPRK